MKHHLKQGKATAHPTNWLLFVMKMRLGGTFNSIQDSILVSGKKILQNYIQSIILIHYKNTH